MDYINLKDKAIDWCLTQRWVEVLCDKGYIPGTYRFSRVWVILKYADKPIDGRSKADRNISWLG